MNIRCLIRQYPVLTYAAFSLAAGMFILLLERMGGGYDDGGAGTAAVMLGLLWNVIAFPFYLSSEVLFSLNDGVRVPGHWFLAAAMGLIVCGLGEVGIRLIRRRRPRVSSV